MTAALRATVQGWGSGAEGRHALSIGPRSGIHFWDPSDAPLLQAAHRSVRKTGSTFPHDALKSSRGEDAFTI